MSKPNIVLITCHDIGRHLGCYGVDTVSTPNINALAERAVRFQNSFCTAPQCSPSRASIYTGRYPHSNGVMGLTHYNFAWDFNPGEKHLAVLLKQAGYKTALIGIQHETRFPENIGFDHLDIKEHPVCESVAQSCINFITKSKADSEPFYLQAGFLEPHRKFDFGGAVPDSEKGVFVPPYLVEDESSKKEFAGFQGAIKKVDNAIGMVINALDEAGVLDNTILIYTADHGIPFPRAKCSLYDPGIEVPFIIRWPERNWQGGRVCQEMISNIDYLPTILDAIGAEVPANVQGRSFCALLDQREYCPRQEIFTELTYHDYYNPMRSIRTHEYKLIANFSSAPAIMNPSQSYRPATITVEPPDPAWAYLPHLELYDLKNDPNEFVDLADKPEYTSIKSDLSNRLLNWMMSTNDQLVHSAVPCPHHNETLSRLQAASKHSCRDIIYLRRQKTT
jgi:N-sulfoglucosamine sulfohydrolase